MPFGVILPELGKDHQAAVAVRQRPQPPAQLQTIHTRQEPIENDQIEGLAAVLLPGALGIRTSGAKIE